MESVETKKCLKCSNIIIKDSKSKKCSTEGCENICHDKCYPELELLDQKDRFIYCNTCEDKWNKNINDKYEKLAKEKNDEKEKKKIEGRGGGLFKPDEINKCIICDKIDKSIINPHLMSHINDYNKHKLSANNFLYLVTKFSLFLYKCDKCEYKTSFENKIKVDHKKTEHLHTSYTKSIPDLGYIISSINQPRYKKRKREDKGRKKSIGKKSKRKSKKRKKSIGKKRNQ
jgi:hypothetical protein